MHGVGLYFLTSAAMKGNPSDACQLGLVGTLVLVLERHWTAAIGRANPSGTIIVCDSWATRSLHVVSRPNLSIL